MNISLWHVHCMRSFLSFIVDVVTKAKHDVRLSELLTLFRFYFEIISHRKMEKITDICINYLPQNSLNCTLLQWTKYKIEVRERACVRAYSAFFVLGCN